MNDDPVTVTQTSGPGVTTWGPLSVLQEIGRGGFGRVYRAWDPVLAREVALKIIQPFEPDAEVLAAILREGQLLARVRHHNVVTIHGALQIENEVGLWMELVRGRSLDDLVKHDGPRAAEEAAVIGSSLCLALAAVHQAGVVHRDVKAHNVMRESGGRIVLMDFGAGALLTERRAQHEHPVGTPVYMAPEVLAGASATVRSDIYSLGVLLYYLVTGTYPVLGRTWTDFLMAHARQERRALADVRPDLAPRFVRIVERATSAHPDERYATPGTMLRDLTDLIAGGEPPTARRATPATDSRRRKKGRPRSRAKRAWRVAAMIAAPIAGMWLLGALASAAFNNTLDRPSGFTGESPLTWLRWGRMAIFPGAVQVTIVLLIAWLVAAAWSLLTRFIPALGNALRSVRDGLVRVTRMNDPDTAAQSLLIAQIAALAAFWWYFRDIFSAAVSIISTASPEWLDPLRPERLFRHQLYNLVMSMLILAMSLGAWQLIKLRRRLGVTSGRATFVAIFAAIAMAFVILAFPYRLIWHNRFEAATYGSMQCYVIGERGSDALLYCPSWEAPKVRTIPRSDPDLRPTGRIESIYTRRDPASFQ